MAHSEGMVAIVRALRDAELAVTVLDSGKQYTLIPNNQMGTLHKPPHHCDPKAMENIQQNMMHQFQQMSFTPRQPNVRHQHHQTSCTQQQQTDLPRKSTAVDTKAAQAVDGRYASTYQTAHCHVSPTSPPLLTREFPPQRPAPTPGQENFVIGESSNAECYQSNSRNNSLKNCHAISVDTGYVTPARPMPYVDSFAASLRKYPSMSPDKTAEMVERLISYTQSKYGTRISRRFMLEHGLTEALHVERAKSPSPPPRGHEPDRRTVQDGERRPAAKEEHKDNGRRPDARMYERESRRSDQRAKYNQPERHTASYSHNMSYQPPPAPAQQQLFKNDIQFNSTAYPMYSNGPHSGYEPGYQRNKATSHDVIYENTAHRCSRKYCPFVSTQTQAAPLRVAKEMSTLSPADSVKRTIAVPLSPTSSSDEQGLRRPQVDDPPTANPPIVEPPKPEPSPSKKELPLKRIETKLKLVQTDTLITDSLADCTELTQNHCSSIIHKHNPGSYTIIQRQSKTKLHNQILELLQDVPLQPTQDHKDIHMRKKVLRKLYEKLQNLSSFVDGSGSELDLIKNIRRHLKCIIEDMGCRRTIKTKCSSRFKLSNSVSRYARKYRKNCLLKKISSELVEERFEKAIFDWYDTLDLKISKYRLKNTLLHPFIERLKTVAAGKQKVQVDYKNILKEEILEFLEDMPLDDNSNHMQKMVLANRLLHKLLRIPISEERLIKQTTLLTNDLVDESNENSEALPSTEIKNKIREELHTFLTLEKVSMDLRCFDRIERNLTEIILDSIDTITADVSDTVVNEIQCVLQEINVFTKVQSEDFSRRILKQLKDKFHRHSSNKNSTKAHKAIEYVDEFTQEDEEPKTHQLTSQIFQPSSALEISKDLIIRHNRSYSCNHVNVNYCTPNRGVNLRFYTELIANQIEEWLLKYRTTFSYAPNFRRIVHNLAVDIVERQKYLEMCKSHKPDDIDELQYLKYQIFNSLYPLLGEKDEGIVNFAGDLMRRIQSLAIYSLTVSTERVNSESDSSSIIFEDSVYHAACTWLMKIPRQDCKYIKDMNDCAEKFAANINRILTRYKDDSPTRLIHFEVEFWSKSVLKDVSKYSNMINDLKLEIKWIYTQRKKIDNKELSYNTYSQFRKASLSGPGKALINQYTGFDKYYDASSIEPIGYHDVNKKRLNRPNNRHNVFQISGVNMKSLNATPAPAKTPQEINIELENFIEDWCEQIPIDVKTDQDREIAELARCGIKNGIVKQILKIRNDLTAMRDRFLCEDMLGEEVDTLLDCLPQTPVMLQVRQEAKVRLLDYVVESNRRLLEAYMPRINQQQSQRSPIIEEDFFKKLHDTKFIDEYIDERYSGGNDNIRLLFKKQLAEELHSVIREYKQKTRFDQKVLKRDVYDALGRIPVPTEYCFHKYAQELVMKIEIEEWVQELPLKSPLAPDEIRHLDENEKDLSEKIANIIDHKPKGFENDVRAEIERFLPLIPLRHGEDPNQEVIIERFIYRLKTSERLKLPDESIVRDIDIPIGRYESFDNRDVLSSTRKDVARAIRAQSGGYDDFKEGVGISSSPRRDYDKSQVHSTGFDDFEKGIAVSSSPRKEYEKSRGQTTGYDDFKENIGVSSSPYRTRTQSTGYDDFKENIGGSSSPRNNIADRSRAQPTDYRDFKDGIAVSSSPRRSVGYDNSRMDEQRRNQPIKSQLAVPPMTYPPTPPPPIHKDYSSWAQEDGTQTPQITSRRKSKQSTNLRSGEALLNYSRTWGFLTGDQDKRAEFAATIIVKVTDLHQDPNMLSNDLLYEQAVENILYDALKNNSLSESRRDAVIADLLGQMKTVRELVISEREVRDYKQEVMDTVAKLINEKNARVKNNISLKQNPNTPAAEQLADAAVEMQYEKGDTKEELKIKLVDRISNYIDESRTNNTLVSVDENQITTEILRSILDIPAPPIDMLAHEVEEIRLKESIYDYVKKTAVPQSVDQERQDAMIALLVKKVAEIKRGESADRNVVYEQLKFATYKFFDKILNNIEENRIHNYSNDLATTLLQISVEPFNSGQRSRESYYSQSIGAVGRKESVEVVNTPRDRSRPRYSDDLHCQDDPSSYRQSKRKTSRKRDTTCSPMGRRKEDKRRATFEQCAYDDDIGCRCKGREDENGVQIPPCCQMPMIYDEDDNGAQCRYPKMYTFECPYYY